MSLSKDAKGSLRVRRVLTDNGATAYVVERRMFWFVWVSLCVYRHRDSAIMAAKHLAGEEQYF